MLNGGNVASVHGGPPLRQLRVFGNTLDKALTAAVGCASEGAWPSGGRTARPLDWKGMGQRPCVWRRMGLEECHNAAGARGNRGWHCAAHQAVPPRVRQGSGG